MLPGGASGRVGGTLSGTVGILDVGTVIGDVLLFLDTSRTSA